MNAVLPTMVLTFLNVRPEYYHCQQPENMHVNLSKSQWLDISGQIKQADGTVDKCSIVDIDYPNIIK